MRDIATLQASYELRAPLAGRFAARLSEQVAEIFSAEGVTLAVPIEARVKTWASLADKVLRNSLTISDAGQITDLVGLRIILLFKRDVQRVVDLISSSLTITSKENTLDRLGVAIFGYQSIHLQAEIPGDWGSVPTLRDFVGLQAEIQIRTAAQHMWAAASHTLQYKAEASVPPSVLRSVNRVAALLETVDLEFERALASRDEYLNQADRSLKSHRLSIEAEALNVDLLEKVLDQLLPAKNKESGEDLANLLDELYAANMRQVLQLRSFVSEWLPTVLPLEEKIALALQKKAARIIESGNSEPDDHVMATVNGGQYFSMRDRAQKGIFYTHAGLVRSMLERAGLRVEKEKNS